MYLIDLKVKASAPKVGTSRAGGVNTFYYILKAKKQRGKEPIWR